MKYNILYKHNDGGSHSLYNFEVESDLDLQSQECERVVRDLALKESVKYHQQGIGSINILSIEKIKG